MWRSLVARFVRDEEAVGSNPATPTGNRRDRLVPAIFWVKGQKEGYRRKRGALDGLRVKMCVWLGVSRGLDLAFLNAD